MHKKFQTFEEPTPLTKAQNLPDHLGSDLWIKRDGLAGLFIEGDKSHQRDNKFGAAIEEKAETILITGANQSNFVRLAAATAYKAGLYPIVHPSN